MENLWAPWRLDYITSQDKNTGGCVFCESPKIKDDKENYIVYRGIHCYVILNRFPYNNGHLLVSPVKHVPSLEHLSDKEALDLLNMVRRSIGILKKTMNPEGFNVGLNLGQVAGAGMEEHMHFHIVPRWNGDTNYMTVFGEVRVIPEHIKETYRKLRLSFDKLRDVRDQPVGKDI